MNGFVIDQLVDEYPAARNSREKKDYVRPGPDPRTFQGKGKRRKMSAFPTETYLTLYCSDRECFEISVSASIDLHPGYLLPKMAKDKGDRVSRADHIALM